MGGEREEEGKRGERRKGVREGEKGANERIGKAARMGGSVQEGGQGKILSTTRACLTQTGVSCCLIFRGRLFTKSFLISGSMP